MHVEGNERVRYRVNSLIYRLRQDFAQLDWNWPFRTEGGDKIFHQDFQSSSLVYYSWHVCFPIGDGHLKLALSACIYVRPVKIQICTSNLISARAIWSRIFNNYAESSDLNDCVNLRRTEHKQASSLQGLIGVRADRLCRKGPLPDPGTSIR